MDRIYLAQEKVHWQALVKTVTEIIYTYQTGKK